MKYDILSAAPRQPGARREMTWKEHLAEQLHRERIVFLWGPINFESANLLIMELFVLQSQAPDREIKLYITSQGGDMGAGFAIYDTMRFLTCDVSTYCVGLAASAAAIILAAGTKGKRYALPHSEIMIHQGRGITGGQAADIQIAVQQYVKFEKRVNEVLAEHTGKSVEQIARDIKRNRWMTPEEAKDYGIVDEIIDTEPEKDKKDKKDEKDNKDKRAES